MKRILLASSLISIYFPLSGQAQDLNVDFTATVLETTCNITLSEDGTAIANNGTDKYALTIPDVGLDKIAKADPAAQANFKLVASGCSAGIGSIVTKLSGATISGNLIKNAATSNAATNIGMGIKRKGDADSAFITPNNTSSISWTADEIANGLPMTVALRETTSGTGGIGSFTAKATFNFTYN
ncbi:fimbrial protein [Salmonella enterica subsp. enterica serovar Kotte]|nr:fimbrial protein [Salmonella enterica subsp. enterica serovar Kotte]